MCRACIDIYNISIPSPTRGSAWPLSWQDGGISWDLTRSRQPERFAFSILCHGQAFSSRLAAVNMSSHQVRHGLHSSRLQFAVCWPTACAGMKYEFKILINYARSLANAVALAWCVRCVPRSCCNNCFARLTQKVLGEKGKNI